MEHPRLTLAEYEMEMDEFRCYAEALQQVLVTAGNLTPDEWLEVAELRNIVTTINEFPPDWRRWLEQS